MKKLIDLDTLTRHCGYFGETKGRDGHVKNNGYGCKHRGNKEAPGCCYGFSCPIAFPADYEDLLELDPELAKEYQDEQERYGLIESDLMIVWRPYYIKKVFGSDTK